MDVCRVGGLEVGMFGELCSMKCLAAIQDEDGEGVEGEGGVAEGDQWRADGEQGGIGSFRGIVQYKYLW